MSANGECVFCKIVDGEIPSTKVYENDDLLAFRDLNPQAPTHVLVIPKRHFATAADLAAADAALGGALVVGAHHVAELDGVAESGYRLVFNSGEDAQQTVHHVHCHVLGGRNMTWPPG